jgi:hypothetical protein
VLAIVLPSFQVSLDLAIKLIVFLLGCIALFFVFACLVSGKVRGLLDSIQTLVRAADKWNAVLVTILPTVLHGLEDNKVIEGGSESKLISIISSEYTTAESPRKLNKKGTLLLENSNMRDIVDSNIDSLTEQLEHEKLDNLLDLEQRCLCVLRRMKNPPGMARLKNYVWTNPELNIYYLLFVGSLYLRDRYLERHPEVLEAAGISFK